MNFLKKLSLFITSLFLFTFFYGCSTDTIDDLERRIANLENTKPDTIFIFNHDTLYISDSIYFFDSTFVFDTLVVYDTVYLVNDSVLYADVSLNSQAAVEAFSNRGITGIIGELNIIGSITDLTPLSSLTSVGNLYIEVDQLTSLIGLENLKNVDAELGIYSSYPSTFFLDAGALDGLTTVKKVDIVGNVANTTFSNLKSVEYLEIGANQDNIIAGFNGLEEVGKLQIEYSFYDNTPFNISGFGSLITVKDWLKINANQNTPLTLNAFSNLTSIGGDLLIGETYWYANSPEITLISAFENLANIGGRFRIAMYMSSLSSFSKLETIGGEFAVPNGSFLNLSELSSLTSLGTLSIGITDYNNLFISAPITNLGLSLTQTEIIDITISSPSLLSLDGLESITNVTGSVRINESYEYDNNGSYIPIPSPITDASGLSNISNIGGLLFLQLPKVNNLSFLNNISSIGRLELRNMPQFTDLSSLSSLTELHGLNLHSLENLETLDGFNLNGNSSFTELSIWSCNLLIDISNLTNVVELSGQTQCGDNGYLVIGDNSKLSNLDGLENIIFNGDLTVYNNLMLDNFCAVKAYIDNTCGLNINSNLFNPQSAAEIVGCP